MAIPPLNATRRLFRLQGVSSCSSDGRRVRSDARAVLDWPRTRERPGHRQPGSLARTRRSPAHGDRACPVGPWQPERYHRERPTHARRRARVGHGRGARRHRTAHGDHPMNDLLVLRLALIAVLFVFAFAVATHDAWRHEPRRESAAELAHPAALRASSWSSGCHRHS